MYRIMSSSKDTYITNKVIDNSFTASDANVGKAGTLDLFKLYNESNTILISQGEREGVSGAIITYQCCRQDWRS